VNYWKITVVNLFGICITLHELTYFQPYNSNIYIIITKIITNDWLVCFIFHGVMGQNTFYKGNMPNYCFLWVFVRKMYKRADTSLKQGENNYFNKVVRMVMISVKIHLNWFIDFTCDLNMFWVISDSFFFQCRQMIYCCSVRIWKLWWYKWKSNSKQYLPWFQVCSPW
jgi:hypothetical protein